MMMYSISMLSWLKKLFIKKDNILNMKNENDVNKDIASIVSSNTNTINTNTVKKRKHKLEIQIYEADYTDVPEGAKPKWRPVDMGRDRGKPIIIEVADKKELMELQQRYAMCDQQMKIIREIDPFDDEPTTSKTSAIPLNNQAIPIQSTSSTVDSASIQQIHVIPSSVETQQVKQIASASHIEIIKPKPKIVTIGDIEVKYDGDKVYQRQWMKLTPIEAANFRVVNDATNKIISMNGKHLEAKRWIVVEEQPSNEQNDIVESLTNI